MQQNRKSPSTVLTAHNSTGNRTFMCNICLMLNFITTVTNVNNKLYNKTIVDYLGIGYGVGILNWRSTIASVGIGKL